MNRVFVRLAAVVLTVSVAGCSSPVEPASPPEGAVNLLLQPVEDGFPVGSVFGKLPDRERLVVRDSDAWADLWDRMTSGRFPQPPAPEVDFDSEMVIVVSMGGRPTGGFTIGVVQVAELDGTVYVVVEERSPGSGCIVTMALTAPVAAVRVPRRDGPVTFLERESVTDCG